jgi:transcriptional regulator with XRE-family HTH domain
MTAQGVVELLKIRLERAGFKTNLQAALAIGISDSHLSHVLSGKDKPGPKLLRWMELKRAYTNRRPFTAVTGVRIPVGTPVQVAKECHRAATATALF